MNRIKLAQEFANYIKSNNKIKKIILFGSVARNDDSEDSDIDILIVSSSKDEIFDFIYDKILEILIKDEELISAHIMPEKKFNNEKKYSFLSTVIKEGVVLG